jgi:malonate-semialdehyde dehydrogenase (acetylating)/methylmalonate-semialdehyde dehydrogenase
MCSPRKLPHYFGGGWKSSKASEYLDVINPATSELLGQVPLATEEEVDAAVRGAAAACPD